MPRDDVYGLVDRIPEGRLREAEEFIKGLTEVDRFVFGVDLDGVVADFYKGLKPLAADWLGVDVGTCSPIRRSASDVRNSENPQRRPTSILKRTPSHIYLKLRLFPSQEAINYDRHVEGLSRCVRRSHMHTEAVPSPAI
jgi:hypothetical protein